MNRLWSAVSIAIALGSGVARAAVAGSLTIDGSSTVYPITEAVAEEFLKANPKARVTVGISGTGGGFKKFCNAETDISNASRPIKPTEVEACKAKGVEYIELPIAYDGLAILANLGNDWADCITVKELKALWEPEAQGKITKWSQVRPGWPDKNIHLFGAGVDSGTYDYFTEAVVGKEHASRGDFQSSEDDNVLVQGITTDPLALGFFGYAYYEANKGNLKVLGVDDEKPDTGSGCVKPSVEAVERGTYQPLSRPLFIYVRKDAAEKPIVKAFVESYLTNAPELVREVGYIPFKPDAYKLVQSRFAKGVTSSLFEGKGSQVGVTIDDLLKREAE
jgi:phosphate transport system substrate-binding protein